MSAPLDRPGIFKAKPFDWKVIHAESGAVAVSIGFEIVAQLNKDNDWDDWGQYEPHHCYGSWWVVKKDRSINQPAVDQLTQCLGWDGSLQTVAGSAAPETVVQINIAQETYKDKQQFRATWMNPENFVPSGAGASETEVAQIEAQFGSLLRAAASASAAVARQAAEQPTATAAPPPVDNGPPPITDEDIPF